VSRLRNSRLRNKGPRHAAQAQLCPERLKGKVAVMTDTDSTPEGEYAEEGEEPEVPLDIPLEEPEADVLEQRQEVPIDQDEDEPWWDETTAEARPAGEERD